MYYSLVIITFTFQIKKWRLRVVKETPRGPSAFEWQSWHSEPRFLVVGQTHSTAVPKILYISAGNAVSRDPLLTICFHPLSVSPRSVADPVLGRPTPHNFHLVEDQIKGFQP